MTCHRPTRLQEVNQRLQRQGKTRARFHPGKPIVSVVRQHFHQRLQRQGETCVRFLTGELVVNVPRQNFRKG